MEIKNPTNKAVVPGVAPADAENALGAVYDAMGVGRSQPIGILLTCIANTKKFSDLLSSVESKFFMVPGSTDDLEEEDRALGLPPDDVCLLNRFGSTKEQYLIDFERALKQWPARGHDEKPVDGSAS